MIHKCYIEDIPIDLGSKAELMGRITGWLGKTEKPRRIVTLNSLMLIAALKNLYLNKVIQNADLVTVDGRGILLVLRKNGYQHVEQLTGLDITKNLLSACLHGNYSVYFYGGAPEVARLLPRKLSQNWPGLRICAIRDGYGCNLTRDQVMEEMVQKQPSLVLAGIGSPAQEIFLAEVLPFLKSTVGIGVGGVLDVISGVKRETPSFMREHALEWLYRMLQDPVKLKRFPDLVIFWYKFLRNEI